LCGPQRNHLMPGRPLPLDVSFQIATEALRPLTRFA
jgi:hypothetical protein